MGLMIKQKMRHEKFSFQFLCHLESNGIPIIDYPFMDFLFFTSSVAFYYPVFYTGFEWKGKENVATMYRMMMLFAGGK